MYTVVSYGTLDASSKSQCNWALSVVWLSYQEKFTPHSMGWDPGIFQMGKNIGVNFLKIVGLMGPPPTLPTIPSLPSPLLSSSLSLPLSSLPSALPAPLGSLESAVSSPAGSVTELNRYRIWCISALNMASGGSNFNYFPENQIGKLPDKYKTLCS